ncbi:MAG: 3-deoxy-D-manno-octulosonic acid transferase [Oxalobacter sp.]|nr:MAG: 3-deoxy-D-manno-octulosonic acid transferase [Oxalobacter sp.]
MRLLYSFLWWLILPFALLRLWWRGRKEPGYRQHIAERLGFYAPVPHPQRPKIWLHAVSVGETRAAEPLLVALLIAYPDHDIVLTHMTATGRETGATLFSTLRPRVLQYFLPYDTAWMMTRFLRHFSPQLCILMETEIWPNLIAQCKKFRVPVALVNARMSARSLTRAGIVSSLMSEAAGNITCVAAQTHADSDRLLQYGAKNVHVTGSVKFDVTPPDSVVSFQEFLRARIGSRPVFLWASTREGEEALLLDALPALKLPDALIILVPRHPQRFDDVAKLVMDHQLPLFRRSELEDVAHLPKDIRILLGDSMGEMFGYYAAADLAFIGGSLLPLGGQNLIEACAVGTPVLIGPHTFNFDTITRDAENAHAAVVVQTAEEAMHMAKQLLADTPRLHAMSHSALSFAQAQRGATERTIALLRPLLALSGKA